MGPGRDAGGAQDWQEPDSLRLPEQGGEAGGAVCLPLSLCVGLRCPLGSLYPAVPVSEGEKRGH